MDKALVHGLASGSGVKNLPAMQETQEIWVQSLGQEDPWKRKWQPTPIFLPGKSHGQRSLEGYSPWATESDTAEHKNSYMYVYIQEKPRGSPTGRLKCSGSHTVKSKK